MYIVIHTYTYIYVGAREWTVSRSVRWSVCRLVGWSVRPSVGWPVRCSSVRAVGQSVRPLSVCRSFVWVRGWDCGSTGQAGRPVWLVMPLGWPLNPAGHPVHPYTRSCRPADPAIPRSFKSETFSLSFYGHGHGLWALETLAHLAHSCQNCSKPSH